MLQQLCDVKGVATEHSAAVDVYIYLFGNGAALADVHSSHLFRWFVQPASPKTVGFLMAKFASAQRARGLALLLP